MWNIIRTRMYKYILLHVLHSYKIIYWDMMEMKSCTCTYINFFYYNEHWKQNQKNGNNFTDKWSRHMNTMDSGPNSRNQNEIKNKKAVAKFFFKGSFSFSLLYNLTPLYPITQTHKFPFPGYLYYCVCVCVRAST